MKKIYVATAALLASTALAAAPVFAAEKTPDLSRQIQQLQDQLRSMQQQLEAVKANAAADRDTVAKETAAREVAAREQAAKDAITKEDALKNGAKIQIVNGKSVMTPAPLPKVTQSGTNRFALSSADGAWTIAPTGRVHFDIGTYLDQKPESGTGVGNVGNKLTSGVNVRRGRLGVTGKAMTDFTYTFIIDGGGATDNATLINTAQLSYTGFKNTSIDVGYFAQYFTMEESMSSNDIVFMERSTPTTLASSFGAGDPRFGAGVRTWDSRMFLAAYFTGSKPGDTHALTQRGWSAYQRAAYQLIQEDTQTLHLGVGAIELLSAPDTGPNTARTITFSERPELRIDPTNLLNTGALGTIANPVKSAQVYNVETAATYGNWFYQGEYFRYVVNRTGKPKANFDGAYGLLAYSWGGRRSYSANSGAYGGINPISPFSLNGGGMGAFEVAARISYANLVDQYNSSLTNASQPFAINGGRQLNFTGALNWYLNSNMLVKLNYIHSKFSKANATTTGFGGGIPVGTELDSLAARFQFVF